VGDLAAGHIKVDCLICGGIILQQAVQAPTKVEVEQGIDLLHRRCFLTKSRRGAFAQVGSTTFDLLGMPMAFTMQLRVAMTKSKC
jgi:hypothetical protein